MVRVHESKAWNAPPMNTGHRDDRAVAELQILRCIRG